MLLTASDVIHAWWVPSFGMKKDAIPGFINELWFRADEPGVYRGQCAELCGRDHAFMPVVVEVMPQADYDNWLASAKQAAAPAGVADQVDGAATPEAPAQAANASGAAQ